MLVKPPSLDLQLDLEPEESYDAPSPVIRVSSRVIHQGPSRGSPLSVSCCVTPRTSAKRKSFSIIVDVSRPLDAKLRQRTRTVLSFDFNVLRLLLLLACCVSTAAGLVLPAAAAIQPRRLALEPAGRSRLAAGDVALYPTVPSPLQLASATVSALSSAALDRSRMGSALGASRLDLARSMLGLRYRAEHVLGGQHAALVAPLTSLSTGICNTLFPLRYRAVRFWHSQLAEAADAELEAAQARLAHALEEALGPAGASRAQLCSRVKTELSLFDKAVLRGKATADLLGMRVVVGGDGTEDTDADCYRVARLVARLWPEGELRLKDYIATPKPNGYQSLHLLVTLRPGVEMEVQIRTARMHDTAERGSAAHALYKAAAGVASSGERSGVAPPVFAR